MLKKQENKKISWDVSGRNKQGSDDKF